jgi:hypothetical protein
MIVFIVMAVGDMLVMDGVFFVSCLCHGSMTSSKALKNQFRAETSDG